jgi:hypothetical protein
MLIVTRQSRSKNRRLQLFLVDWLSHRAMPRISRWSQPRMIDSKEASLPWGAKGIAHATLIKPFHDAE